MTGGISTGVNCPGRGAVGIGGNCPERNCPGGLALGVIGPGAMSREVIVPGANVQGRIVYSYFADIFSEFPGWLIHVQS